MSVTFPAPSLIAPAAADSRYGTQGVQLAVYEQGPSDGTPVVLLHGFPELAYSWRHQLPALAAAGYRHRSTRLRPVGQTRSGA